MHEFIAESLRKNYKTLKLFLKYNQTHFIYIYYTHEIYYVT